MAEAIPYPSPPPGPLRDVAACLRAGVLSPQNAQMLLHQGVTWSLVAPHVQDRDWWQAQRPATASPPTLPWVIRAWDATLHLEVPGESLWIDPGPQAPDPSSLSPPDLIVVTHAHHDHVARLGEYSATYPSTPVVMSHETAALLSLRARSDPSLRECLDLRTVRLHLGEQRTLGGVQLKLLPAGHLLGAATPEIGLGEDKLLITGDFALRDVGGVPGATWPEESYTLIVMEATEGERGSLPMADPEANRKPFLQEVSDLLGKGKRRLLVPSQAMGQAQELYAGLALAQQAGAFPNLRVRLAGFAAMVSEMYQEALETLPGPWECPFFTLAMDQVPDDSLVIASGGDPDREGGLANRLASTLEKSTDGQTLWHPTVSTHAGWGERMALVVGVPCHAVVLYHGFSLSLQTALSEMGRKAGSLSLEGEEWIAHNNL